MYELSLHQVRRIYDRLEELAKESDITKMAKIKIEIESKLTKEICDEILSLPLDEEKKDMSILMKAMSIPTEKRSLNEKEIIKDIIVTIINRVPKMIVAGRKKPEYDGLTPVHLAILKTDKELLEEMVRVIKMGNIKEDLQNLCAEGYAFQDTIMMAGTPLGVATLTIKENDSRIGKQRQEEIFQIVLHNFAKGICAVNRKGDNIIHSLIKYSHVQPVKMSAKQVNYTVNYVLNQTSNVSKSQTTFTETHSLLTMKNKEKLTPLQLATKRQQYEIFEFIMQHEIYCSREWSDGIIDEDVYDITEIETLPIVRKERHSEQENIKEESHDSILQIIKFHNTVNAFRFANFLPVKEVIRTKWKFYKRIFWPWLIFHLAFMILLTVSAIYRSKLKDNAPGAKIEYSYAVLNNAFVTTAGSLGVFISLLYIIMELIRLSCQRFKYQISSNVWRHLWCEFSSPYSNLSFRFWLVFFSLLLIADFVAAVVDSLQGTSLYGNYCLIFAVIVGWYLVMFFIQTIKLFSFFTVLIQQVISDMFKFSVVMSMFLIAFSTAMYMIMQGADTTEDDFSDFFKTLVKMLTIMLGIGDLGVLFSARQPILAVIIFVLFVLLTTILLLNALIAMMSNTCTGLMTNYGSFMVNKMHCRLQKLSVILFLEGFLPRCLCSEVGEVKEKHMNNSQKTGEIRRLWKQSQVQGQVTSETEKNIDTLNHLHMDLFPQILQQLQKKPKKKRSKNSVSTTDFELQRQHSKRLDITETHLTDCQECVKEFPTIRHTQEIVEIKHAPDNDSLSNTV